MKFYCWLEWDFWSANDVLVPHISAVELDDFSIASNIESQLVENWEGLGLICRFTSSDQEYPELSKAVLNSNNALRHFF